MVDAPPELPEAKDRFERRVAVSIACMAVVLAFISDHADDAKTESILRTNEASNAWAYFQAKSTRQHVSEGDLVMLDALVEGGAMKRSAELRTRLAGDIARYESERDEIKAEAERLGERARHAGEVDDRAGQGALLIQLGIVLASVSILARWPKLWILSVLVVIVGTGLGLSSWWL